MDTEFDGFMKTLNNLNDETDGHIEPTSSFDVDIEDLLRSDGSSHFKNKSETQVSINSISTTVKIENEVHDMDHAMESMDSKPTTGEYASMHHQFMQSIKEIKNLKLSHESNDKASELPARSSIDSRVDAELQQLLETGICEQQEPEQNDTVELSISEDDESESEIVLQHIDDLESVKSAIESTSSPSAANINHKPSEESGSNEPEYDLVSFGITETASSPNHTNGAPLPSVRASLPSTSSFENHPKSQSTIAIGSNPSSIAATPQSNKCATSKQTITSDKPRKSHDSIQDTRFKTPVTRKDKVIQTPRHSIKGKYTSKHVQNRPMEEDLPRLKQALEAEQARSDQLSIQIQSLQTQLTLYKNNTNHDTPQTDHEEAQRMSKEMKSMDRIIAGLNEENAKLIQQLKEHKCPGNVQPNPREQVKHNELSQEFKVQPAVLNEMQRVRKELKETKDTAMCRERELGIQINKLKEDNRTLQFKLDGMDKQSFENESHVIAEFKKEAFKIQKKSQNQINELQRKLKWYIENQELIENLNQQLKDRNQTIQSLKSSQASSPSGKPQATSNTKMRIKPSAKEHRTIVVLKKKVHDLEKLLASAHPDSIANLISIMNSNANGVEDEHQNMIITQLREEIVNLQDALDHKEDDTLARLRGLRQQNDKLQLTWNEKVKRLQQQLTQCKREKGFVRPSAKIKELNKEIVDLKQRLKVAKDKKYKWLNEKQSSVQNLQSMLETEKQSHNALKTQMVSLQNQLNNTRLKEESEHDSDAMTHKSSEQLLKYAQENKTLIYERNALQTQLDLLRKTHAATKTTVHQLEKENGDEKEKMYIEKIAIVEAEIKEYKRQSQVLTEKVEIERTKGEQSVKAMQNQLEWNKLEKEKTQQWIVKLQFELNHAKNTPSYVEYETLLRKLEKIEKRGRDREKELEETYLRLLRSNGEGEEQLTKKYQDVIGNKDEQIRSLQNELSVLMTAFEKINTSS